MKYTVIWSQMRYRSTDWEIIMRWKLERKLSSFLKIMNLLLTISSPCFFSIISINISILRIKLHRLSNWDFNGVSKVECIRLMNISSNLSRLIKISTLFLPTETTEVFGILSVNVISFFSRVREENWTKVWSSSWTD